MVTTIQKFGKTIATPSSFVGVNTKNLEPVGLSSLGPVAILGEAEGGGKAASQMSSPEELLRLANSAEVLQVFRGGDLVDGCRLAFNPSNDPEIPGGATEIIAVKVNPALAASTALLNTKGPVIDVTSRDQGIAQNQLYLDVTTPAATNRSLEVSFGADHEVAAEVGGDGVASLLYTPPTDAWTTMSVQVRDDGIISAVGTRAINGMAADVTAITSGDVATVVAVAGDAGKTMMLFGTSPGGAVQYEIVPAVGTLVTGANPGSKTWGKLLGAKLSAPAAGATTVTAPTGPVTVFTFAAAVQRRGCVAGASMFVANQAIAGRLSLAAAARDVLVFGYTPLGVYSGTKLAFPITVLPKLISSIDLAQITDIVVGDVDDAPLEVLTLSAVVAETTAAHDTLQKVQDYFNTLRTGSYPSYESFVFTLLTGAVELPPSALDELAPVSILTAVTLTDIVSGLTSFMHDRSGYVDAEQSTFSYDVSTVTITPAVALFSITIDGIVAAYNSTLGTAADIQAGLLAAVNGTPGMKNRVTAAASGLTALTLTARSGIGFALPTLSGGLVQVYVQGVGQKTAPANVTAKYLTGGGEGVATQSDWEAGFALLRKLRVRSVVPLTGDPSVHQALKDHLAYVTTLGLNEQDGFVGLCAVDGSNEPVEPFELPNKASIKSQIIALNTKNIRACAQTVDRYDANGVRQTYAPWFQACIAAGMQAGAPLGLPLTRKLANVISVDQAPLTPLTPLLTGWSPERDSDEMLQAGLWFMENVRGLGIRVVRNITTHLSSNNLAFCEGSVNDVLNFICYDWRQDLDKVIGHVGTPITLTAAKTRSAARLNLYVTNQLITSWRALTMTLDYDVLRPNVEIGFPPPINFVDASIYLSAANVTV